MTTALAILGMAAFAVLVFFVIGVLLGPFVRWMMKQMP